MSFQPANLSVTAGTTVTWDFLSGTHNVTSGTAPTSDGAYASPTQTSGTFTHPYSTAGTYHYFCTIHGTMMTGTVTVN
jgi:plastocyanin